VFGVPGDEHWDPEEAGDEIRTARHRRIAPDRRMRTEPARCEQHDADKYYRYPLVQCRMVFTRSTAGAQTLPAVITIRRMLRVRTIFYIPSQIPYELQIKVLKIYD
jgi:hypothetical protein